MTTNDPRRWIQGAAVCLMLCACAGSPPALPHLATDESTEVAYLIHKGTADSLATASLLAHLIDSGADRAGGPARPDPEELIQRAVALAPRRPELLWLQLRDCQTRRCPAEQEIAHRLLETDPDNGLGWLGDLYAAQTRSPEEVTAVIVHMGSGAHPRIYWNALAVMMFDAMTHGPEAPPTAVTQHADDRLLHVTGVLAAVDVPAFTPLALACRREQFEQPGRRAACVGVIERMQTSDAVLTQLFRLSVLESWVPSASSEGEALRQERAQRRYLTVESNRIRPGHVDGDAEARVDAMRRLDTEQEVERAMLTAFGDPLERPANWQPPAGEP